MPFPSKDSPQPATVKTTFCPVHAEPLTTAEVWIVLNAGQQLSATDAGLDTNGVQWVKISRCVEQAAIRGYIDASMLEF